MPPKSSKWNQNRFFGEELSTVASTATHDPRHLRISVELEGECPDGDWSLLVLLLKKTVLEIPWREPKTLSALWSRDASGPDVMAALADEPLVLLLRLPASGKGQVDADPFKEADKCAAGVMDLLPLLLGEDSISAKIRLVYVESGEKLDCCVRVCIKASNPFPFKTAVRITLLRAACLPIGKSETVYVAAVLMSKPEEPILKLEFGTSCAMGPSRSIWASLLPLKTAATTDYPKTEEDVFVDAELKGSDDRECNATKWNMCRRILLDSDLLQTRLSSPLIMEVAGLTKAAKPETRGHFMAMLDLGVLLEPNESSVTVRVPLRKYDSSLLPDETLPMLDLPAPNLYNVPAPITQTELETILDENNHKAYIEISFELSSTLTSPLRTCELFSTIVNEAPKEVEIVDEFKPCPSPPEPALDVHVLKSECGALALHLELEASMVREQTFENRRKPAIAAHQVLKRTKELLKEHQHRDCTSFSFMDVVKSQHSAARRAVTSSFEPQPPPTRAPPVPATARARCAGNINIAESLLAGNLAAEPHNPRPFLSLALRKLEKFDHRGALETLKQALDTQIENRYILWIFGALQSEQRGPGEAKAAAAFRLAISSNTLDGTRRTIGWAALHGHYHRSSQNHAAFIAARNMRKANELPADWCGLLAQWREFSGEEEYLWDPTTISHKHPLVMAAAMFLCFRMYDFANLLLLCSDSNCGNTGSRTKTDEFSCRADAKYVRSALTLMQGSAITALLLIDKAILTHGPSSRYARLRLSCLASRENWDAVCEAALEEAERFGAPSDPAHLLRSAAYTADAAVGLQRAVRAHKAAPSAQTALAVARSKSRLGRDRSAERWAAAAVGLEPAEAEGWAELARQQLAQLKPREARVSLRTARQAGPVSAHLMDEIEALREVVGYVELPELIAEDLCICKFST